MKALDVTKYLALHICHKLKTMLLLCLLLLISFTGVNAQVLSLQSNFTVPENAGTASFTINLSIASSNSITVNYATANNSASSPSDYIAMNGTLTFLPGQVSKTINVSLVNDYIYEGNEQFTLNLSSAIGATLSNTTCFCTIINDDPQIIISNAVSVNENAGTQTFNVTLSAAQSYPVSVHYNTVNGSASAGSDFDAISGNLLFLAGETSKSIVVQIANDYLFESNETYSMVLSSPMQADLLLPMLLSTSTASATILNEDPLISITLPSAITEGNSPQTFTINLSNAVTYNVGVHYTTTNGVASAGNDFVASSGDLIFLPGETSKTISVTILNDFLFELNEFYYMMLSNARNMDINAPMTLNTTNVSASIQDEDPLIIMSTPAAVSENAGPQSIQIQLSAAQTYSVSVQYTTANNAAQSGTDFITASGTLVFAPGETTKVVSITLLNDYLYESNENYIFSLSNAQNLNVSAPMSINTSLVTPVINNDDPYVTINTSNVVESAGVQLFNIVLSSAMSYNVSVHFATQNAGGLAGVDYVATSGNVTFAPGETIKTVAVNIINDYLYEGTVTYSMLLSNALNADVSLPMTILSPLVTANILNDDPYISVAPTAAVSEQAGVQNFTVSLSSVQSYSVSVHYYTVNSSANSSTDYVALNGTLIFLPGETVKVIPVSILNDYLYEPDEIYYFNLNNAQNINASAAMSVPLYNASAGTILNDDPIINILQPATVSEINGTQQFTVTLTPPQAYSVAVNYYTSDNSANDGIDFIPSACTLTFLPGETSKSVSINIIDDGFIEANEFYTLNLSNPEIVGMGIPVLLQTSYAHGIIVDNDTVNCTSNILSMPVISGNTNYCINETLQLSIDAVPNAIGYSWKGPNGFTASGTSIMLNNVNASMAGLYTVKAYKAGGTICDSSAASTVLVTVSSCSNTLNLKLYLQGYYNGAGLMTTNFKNHGQGTNNSMTDSVLIELRDILNTDSVVATNKAQLNINGTAIVSFPGITGSYYVVVKHYNTVSTWSEIPVVIGSSMSQYDFTNAASKAYGANQIEVETGIWAMYSGDLNQDENIDLLDASELESRINNFDSCYLPSDLNGDGNTDLLDTPILEYNIEHFIYSVHP